MGYHEDRYIDYLAENESGFLGGDPMRGLRRMASLGIIDYNVADGVHMAKKVASVKPTPSPKAKAKASTPAEKRATKKAAKRAARVAKKVDKLRKEIAKREAKIAKLQKA